MPKKWPVSLKPGIKAQPEVATDPLPIKKGRLNNVLKVLDHFGNDITKMKLKNYGWEISTLADCANELEPQDLDELIQVLKNDPLFIAEAVARKMEAELQRRVEEEELCPECFTPLEAGNIVRECVGYMGLAAAYQEFATVLECKNCGRREEA